MDTLALITAHKAQLAEFRLQFEDKRNAIDAALETLDRLVDVPEGRTWIATIRQVRTRYAASSAKVFKLMEEDRPDEAAGLMNAEVLPALEGLQAPIKALLELQKKRVPVDNVRVTQKIDSALTMMTVLEGVPAAVWRALGRLSSGNH